MNLTRIWCLLPYLCRYSPSRKQHLRLPYPHFLANFIRGGVCFKMLIVFREMLTSSQIQYLKLISSFLLSPKWFLSHLLTQPPPTALLWLLSIAAEALVQNAQGICPQPRGWLMPEGQHSVMSPRSLSHTLAPPLSASVSCLIPWYSDMSLVYALELAPPSRSWLCHQGPCSTIRVLVGWVLSLPEPS